MPLFGSNKDKSSQKEEHHESHSERTVERVDNCECPPPMLSKDMPTNLSGKVVVERHETVSTIPDVKPVVEMSRTPMYRQEADIHIQTGHREVVERTDIIKSKAQAQKEVEVVSIPIQKMAAAQMEHVRTGVTFTQDKEMVIPGPMYAPPIPSVTHDLLVQGSGGTSAEIHASTNVDLLANAQLAGQSPEEYARYRAGVEQLAHQHEADTTQKADAYRHQVEADAELIRRTLERQHLRDIEFRKDMVSTAVDRQQQEIKMEAEYAMKALEQERMAAERALDQAKMETHIDVKVDSAIGTTVSKGDVLTAAGKEIRENVGPITRDSPARR